MTAEYPKIKYRQDGRTLTVTSREEEDALSGDWADRPFHQPLPGQEKPPACESCAPLRTEIRRMQESYDELAKNHRALDKAHAKAMAELETLRSPEVPEDAKRAKKGR